MGFGMFALAFIVFAVFVCEVMLLITTHAIDKRMEKYDEDQR